MQVLKWPLDLTIASAPMLLHVSKENLVTIVQTRSEKVEKQVPIMMAKEIRQVQRLVVEGMTAKDILARIARKDSIDLAVLGSISTHIQVPNVS